MGLRCCDCDETFGRAGSLFIHLVAEHGYARDEAYDTVGECMDASMEDYDDDLREAYEN